MQTKKNLQKLFHPFSPPYTYSMYAYKSRAKKRSAKGSNVRRQGFGPLWVITLWDSYTHMQPKYTRPLPSIRLNLWKMHFGRGMHILCTVLYDPWVATLSGGPCRDTPPLGDRHALCSYPATPPSGPVHSVNPRGPNELTCLLFSNGLCQNYWTMQIMTIFMLFNIHAEFNYLSRLKALTVTLVHWNCWFAGTAEADSLIKLLIFIICVY